MGAETFSARRAEVLVSGTRAEAAMIGGPLDGIKRLDRATALWGPPLVSKDQEVNEAKDATDARVRDLIGGDALVASGVTMHKDSVVGSRFLLNLKPDWKRLGLDETWAQEFQEEVESVFTLWAESTECWTDAQRTKTFTDSIRLAVGIYAATGEYLETTEWIRDGAARPFKTAFQPVELERLSNPNGVIDSPTMRRGVERDRHGAPIAYHIRKAHPADWNAGAGAYTWDRIPATKPWGRRMVTHIVEQTRPDQTRAVSELSAALSELQMLRRFRGVVLQNALVNSTYAATIESELPSEVVYQAIGGGNMNNPGDVITGYASAYLASVGDYVSGARNMALDGVKIPHLYPGTKLKLQPASAGGPLGTDFEKSLVRYLAAILGVSYEELSKDMEGSNYSSIRASMALTHKRMQARKQAIADRLANIKLRLWMEEAFNKKGFFTTLPKNAPSFYDGFNADCYCNADWIGASRGQIDELKETQAAVLRIAANLSTVEDEAGRLGKDWRKIYAQRAREIKIEEEKKLPASHEAMSKSGSASPASDNPDGQGDQNQGTQPAKKVKAK